ncbi:MAG: hypothetical protein JWM81_1144 [Candidatus Saccharibacteria bacterium]|nr:hypothetical protein [Candidatus Saccharibacteria bacterium]
MDPNANNPQSKPEEASTTPDVTPQPQIITPTTDSVPAAESGAQISHTFAPQESDPAPEATPAAPAEITTPEPLAALPPLAPTVTSGVDAAPVVSTDAPNPVVGGAATGVSSSTQLAGKKSRRKPLILSLIALIILVGAGAAFYLGYWTSSSTIYSSSLANSGKGVEAITSYLQQGTGISAKGYTGDGSYQVKTGDTTIKGKLGFKSNATAFEATANVDLGVKNIDVALRGFTNDKADPDIYLKANNIDGLGALTGSEEIGTVVDQLNNKWIGVDKELLQMLESQGGPSKQITTPTKEQISSALDGFTKVDNQYVFTANKDTAIFKVVKVVGKETVDGRKTYHYQVVPVKENLVKYLNAQQTALKASKLQAWITKNDYQSTVDNAFKSAISTANKASDKDQFDIWSDISQRVVYKIRFPDQTKPASNYVEIGLDYKGGDDEPFFINLVSGKGSQNAQSARLDVSLNTKSSGFKVNFVYDGSNGAKITTNFNAQPSATSPTIDKPTDVVPLSQVLHSLGLDGALAGSPLTAGN